MRRSNRNYFFIVGGASESPEDRSGHAAQQE